MRFFADLNVETPVIEQLRRENHDVLSAAEESINAPDEQILAAATSQDRILITNDKDFAELAFLLRKASAGIILVRLPNLGSAQKARRVAEVIRQVDSRLASAMTVIEAHAARLRELPT
jgi:predicted nuclease of predicted toxin-antitoxin system